ncbi:MAG: polysaccharide deacetylase family protein [Firmicutes bacterium]|nr:polysaccharide deacetylase family protein [Bacillota bacterium]
MNALFISTLVVSIIYTIVPNFYNRNLSKSVIKKFNTKEKEIALTFDDGPDSRYTLELLKILKRNNVKCTFFLVAERTFKNEGVFQKIIKDGHNIGLHSYNHKSAWLSLPNKTKKDFYNSIKTFNKLGENVKYFRPPWGTFNLLTKYYANKYHLKTILWNKNAKDWKKSTSSEDIINRLLKDIRNGDIIVLHDCNGKKDTPVNVLKALEIVIPKLKKEGYKFVTIDEVFGGVKGEVS